MGHITDAPDNLPTANQPLIGGMGIEINGEVITEAKIKFVGGMSPAALKNPPTRRGQTRAYIVLATCEKHHVKEVNEETVVEIDMRPYVIYDRELGPFGDQFERGPEEKGTADSDESDASDGRGGLFDIEGEVTGDLDAEPETVGDAMSGLASVPDLPDDEQPNGEERKAAMFSDGGDE